MHTKELYKKSAIFIETALIEVDVLFSQKDRKLKLICVFTTSMFIFSLISTSYAINVKDTLNIQIEEEILNLDTRSRKATSPFDEVVAYQYQGFLSMIAPGTTTVLMNGIAHSWNINVADNGWTFTLREGAKFHDGSVIKAKTVKYSMIANYMTYYGYDNMSQARIKWESQGYNISYPTNDPNGDGLVVSFSGSYSRSLKLAYEISGASDLYMLIPYGIQGSYTDSTEVCQQKLTVFRESPVSCGPYKVIEQAPQDYVLLERFDDWYGWGDNFIADNGQLYTFPTVEKAFKFVKFRSLQDKAMAIIELVTSGVDVTTGRFNSQRQLDEILTEREGFSAYQIETLGGSSIYMNIQGNWPSYFGGMGNFPLSQSWFRKAVSHSINRTTLVEVVYLGIGKSRTTIFPSWVLDKFSNLDTTDYYNFDQGYIEAEGLLDSAGYPPLGFPEEPENRFGWGPYANETLINGVMQTKGKHFVLITKNCDQCMKKVVAVMKDLRQIGIYVDVEIYNFGDYFDVISSGNPGFTYNTTGPQPDPDFEGPVYDFYLGAFNGNYETPWDFIAYQSFFYWLYYGYGGNSWFNIDYEEAYAKATDGKGLMEYFSPGFIPYNPPLWSNDDTQFIQGCEDAGYYMTHDMNSIHLVWYKDTYAYNSRLENFLGSRSGFYHAAYSYWNTTGLDFGTTTELSTTPTITSFAEITSIIGIICLALYYKLEKRVKKKL